ncbi:MAG: hypothetical protein K8J31_19955 [Anaerolineae bacterium]|nr:hypothetical protein [Anaerolineae bacterium]
MSIGGLLFFLLLLGGTALLVIYPLLRREARGTEDAQYIQKQRERLLVYYERVLTNLRDLDEDHATGKMPDTTYQAEREDWEQRGIQVLKTLDTLDDHSVIPTSVHDDAAVDEAIDQAIEAAIAARRKATN